MVVYLRTPVIQRGMRALDIVSVYSKVIIGNYFHIDSRVSIDEVPPLFISKYIIDDVGKYAPINDGLQWFHYEMSDKMLIFDHFQLPHYVRGGDRVLFVK